MKEKITLTEKTIENDKIKITSDCTIFANCSRLPEININDILDKHKEIVKIAKQKGIKVSYKNKSKKTLMEHKDLYLQEVKQRNQIFDTLKNKWKSKLKKGLYCGLSDDEEYHELSELDRQLQRYGYRSTSISIVSEINHMLDKQLNSVTYNNDIEKIFI